MAVRLDGSWLGLVALALVCGCGEVNRPVGSLGPELGEAGGAGPEPSEPAVGSPTRLEQPWRSSGCGQALPAQQVTSVPGSRTGYSEFFITQTGATLEGTDSSKAGERQFFVRVPRDYDENRAYRVVYLLQGCGALRAANTSTYALFDESLGGSEQAVYVALSVPDSTDLPGCYDHASGAASQEWEAFDLVHSFVESRYCVDNNRIYSVGFDSGGTLSNMWGCHFGGIPAPPRQFSSRFALRGHAAVGDYRQVNIPMPCNGASAALWIHDVEDKVNSLVSSNAALYLSLLTNGCEVTTDLPFDESNESQIPDIGPKRTWAAAAELPGLEGDTCQLYTGCPATTAAQHPVVFCTTRGRGHDDQASSVIPALTTFFGLMDPK